MDSKIVTADELRNECKRLGVTVASDVRGIEPDTDVDTYLLRLFEKKCYMVKVTVHDEPDRFWVVAVDDSGSPWTAAVLYRDVEGAGERAAG